MEVEVGYEGVSMDLGRIRAVRLPIMEDTGMRDSWITLREVISFTIGGDGGPASTEDQGHVYEINAYPYDTCSRLRPKASQRGLGCLSWRFGVSHTPQSKLFQSACHAPRFCHAVCMIWVMIVHS